MDFVFEEIATFTGGTSIPLFDNNRVTSGTPPFDLKEDVTVTTTGTNKLIEAKLIYLLLFNLHN